MEIFAIALMRFLVIFLLLMLIFRPLRVVRDYERLVVLRLGRYVGERGPGLVGLWPFVDQTNETNLSEDFLEIPSQTCITQDNAPIDIDFLIYWKVVEPGLSVIKVRDFAGASRGIATTTLGAVISDIALDDVLAKREQINQILRAKLDEVTERWCQGDERRDSQDRPSARNPDGDVPADGSRARAQRHGHGVGRQARGVHQRG